MQQVSKSYKESMKSSLRERGYIMITFGLINQKAQNNASVDDGDFTYYSTKNYILDENRNVYDYGTFEEDFIRVDGSMYFLPRQNSRDKFLDNGIVSNKLVSDEDCEVMINLNSGAIDLKGLTIHFGENYPVEFDLESSKGDTISVTNNTKSVWTTEEVLTKTTFVKITVHRMRHEHSRLRIYSIKFGYGIIYYNDSVIDSSLTSYVSPIGADVPQIDFSVQLKNYDGYFNVDNPKSAINYLETGQQMNIYYGYQLPETSEIEWIKGGHLLCSEWESNDYTATIKCQDVLRSMNSMYNQGAVTTRSYYDLAVAVFTDAGISSYYIDPYLKTLTTNNPIPRVTHKEALQIIANACRSVLSQSRDGKICITSNFEPTVSVSSTSQANWSNVSNIITDNVACEYGILEANAIPTDRGDTRESIIFLPTNSETFVSTTGYVSSETSKSDCTFNTSPNIEITLNTPCKYYGLTMNFGEELPSEFNIVCLDENSEVLDTVTVKSDEISKSTVIHYEFPECMSFKFEFVKTQYPYNRIAVNKISLSDVIAFTMERGDMTSSPKAIKQELIKNIIVPYHNYTLNTSIETLISEDVTVSENDEVVYYFSDPCYCSQVQLEGQSGGVSIIGTGGYWVKLKYTVSGTYKLVVNGQEYKKSDKSVVIALNTVGKDITWENPLLDNASSSMNVANWLADYYRSVIEYEYNTRGNPELDANDVIYQENEYHNNMKVNVYRHTLKFKQSFSGSVVARRVGD